MTSVKSLSYHAQDLNFSHCVYYFNH